MNTRRKSFVSRTNSRRKPSGLQRGKVGEAAGQAVPRPRCGLTSSPYIRLYLRGLTGEGTGKAWANCWHLDWAAYVQVELIAGLRDRRVADIMDHVCPTVEGHLTLQDCVDDYMFRTGRRCFVVVQNGRVTGLITPHGVRTVDRASWSQTSVALA